MKGDPHPAAVRLAAALPMRRHEQDFIEEAPQKKSPPSHTKQVRIDGTDYSSVRDAARLLGKPPKSIRRWLKSGRAHVIE